MYEKVYLYYFSGTGNARAAAQWFSEEVVERGIPRELQQVFRHQPVLKPESDEKNLLIGFFFPTHGFNAAPAMLKFILRFKHIQGASVFLVNTRAGMKISKLFVPGLSGLAQLLPAMILFLKGFRVVAMQPLDLPSNWISLHPGVKEKVAKSIFERCESIIRRFAVRILSGKTKYKALLSLPFDLLVAPISFAYYFFGRYILAKTFISTNRCNACNICEQQCPVGAIQMMNGRPFWGFTCESCMKCMNNCPEKAIQTAHLYSFIWWYILWALLPALGIWIALEKEIHHLVQIEWLASNIMTILLWLVSLPLIALTYRLLHAMGRISWLDRSVFFTSLTSFGFWRRYIFGLKTSRVKSKIKES